MPEFNAEILLRIVADDIYKADELADEVASHAIRRMGRDGYAKVAGLDRAWVKSASVEAVAERRRS